MRRIAARIAAFPDTGFQPPTQFPEWNPTQEELPRTQGIGGTELNTQKRTTPAWPIDAAEKLQAQGWWQCPTQKDTRGKPCGYWVNPTAIERIKQGSGYITCPNCKHSYDLLDELPQSDDFVAGGKSRIGIPMADQGQIGENIVSNLKEIPGYGPIVWWHPGGSNSNSPLDGATTDWGIEVKTIAYDALHHRFAPGGESGRNTYEDKNQAAEYLGLKGILGILVMLDYRRSVADIYVKPMPIEPWEFTPGRFTRGVAAFRKDTAQKLVAEVPFKNPYMDPNNPSPLAYQTKEYYNPPEQQLPEGIDLRDFEELPANRQQPTEAIPF
jgi:hypothetical protein